MMKKKTLSLLVALIAFIVIDKSSCRASPTKYDQRQTGDVNVQVHLKDIQVVALLDSDLLDDYVDYNYAYDYSDFTIKPGNKPTRTTPSSTTMKKNGTTWPTQPSTTTAMSPAAEIPVSTSSSLNSTVNEEKIISTTPESLMVTTGAPEVISSAMDNMADDLMAVDRKDPTKKCRSGFTRDATGRCRRTLRRRLSILPLAMKLVPKMTGATSKDLRVASWMSTNP